MAMFLSMKSKQSFDLSWYVNGYHIAFRYKSWDSFGLGFQLLSLLLSDTLI